MNSGDPTTNQTKTIEPDCRYHCRMPVFVMTCFLIAFTCSMARGDEKTGHAMTNQWSLSTLMKALAQVKSDNPRFVQRQYLHELTQPLVSSGVLVYRAPDYLEQKTEFPSFQRAVIQGDHLTLYSSAWKGPRTLSLQSSPGIRAVVESLRATLSGQLPVLQRSFNIKINGSSKHWSLEFRPLARALKKEVRLILLRGSDRRIDRIEIHYSQGNYSITLLSRNRP